jgi:hypothetical protein
VEKNVGISMWPIMLNKLNHLQLGEENVEVFYHTSRVLNLI